MKTSLLTISLAMSSFIFAQDNAKPAQSEKNKIETIKIVNGDTVLHEVKIISGSYKEETRHHQRMKKSPHSNHHDSHQKMIVVMDDDMDAEAIEESLNEVMAEGDGEKSEKVVRIVKVNVDDSDDARAKTIVISKSSEISKSIDEDGERQLDSQKALLEMENEDGFLEVSVELKEDINCSLRVSDANNVLLEKSYSKAGEYNEKIKTGRNKAGTYRAELSGDGIKLISKIIIE